MNFTHLNAIEQRLHNERARLAAATSEAERKMRSVWVEGIEKEMKAERVFLGLPETPQSFDELLDDDLFNELTR